MVTSPFTMMILPAAAALLLLSTLTGGQYLDDCSEDGVGFSGDVISTPSSRNSADKCKQQCAIQGNRQDPSQYCKYWTWQRPSKQCTLFSTKGITKQFKEINETYGVEDVVSGPRFCRGKYMLYCFSRKVRHTGSTFVYKWPNISLYRPYSSISGYNFFNLPWLIFFILYPPWGYNF